MTILERLNSNKISIGTAQFGSEYGISNTTGLPSDNEIERILLLANRSGINYLDTAYSYNSEQIIGRIGIGSFDIVTKIKSQALSFISDDHIKIQLIESLKRLKVGSVYAILMHDAKDLLGKNSDKLFNSLMQLKHSGLCNKIGASFYDISDLERVIESYKIDIVQFPMNVLDRRLENQGFLKSLKARGIEIHIRSVFLQGLLLMNPKAMPAYFSQWNSIFSSWEQWLEDRECSAIESCLSYVFSHKEVDKVVLGVECEKQLSEILSARLSDTYIPYKIQSSDKRLINPSLWTE